MTLSAVHVLFALFEPVDLQFFFEAAMPTHGLSGVRTTDLLYRTRQRYPHAAPPKYFGVPQMSGCLSPRHLRVLIVRRQYRLRHGTFNLLSRAHCKLKQTYHGGGELLALFLSLTSRRRLARESTAPKFFYVFAQLCLLVHHHHNSLRPSSVNTTPD